MSEFEAKELQWEYVCWRREHGLEATTEQNESFWRMSRTAEEVCGGSFLPLWF